MREEGVERRLTTILAADVVGYSRLMGEDEAGTLAALKAHRKELFELKEAQHRGRTVKFMGDGVLMEFGSVVDAVSFAVDVQDAMRMRNKEIPENRQIVFRIGINIGDIIVEGDDIYGDGVNVTSRLEGLAEPGGICVARNVRNQVRDKLDLDLDDLGEVEVKNIVRPVHVYRIVLDGQSQDLDIVGSHRNASRRRWIVGVGIITFLAAGGLYAWTVLELGQHSSSEAGCTDHLGLPVSPEKCPKNQE